MWWWWWWWRVRAHVTLCLCCHRGGVTVGLDGATFALFH
eukprot:COSAG03_NODE_22337_length_292_cov_0.808290_2_plen_38_part_01